MEDLIPRNIYEDAMEEIFSEAIRYRVSLEEHDIKLSPFDFRRNKNILGRCLSIVGDYKKTDYNCWRHKRKLSTKRFVQKGTAAQKVLHQPPMTGKNDPIRAKTELYSILRTFIVLSPTRNMLAIGNQLANDAKMELVPGSMIVKDEKTGRYYNAPIYDLLSSLELQGSIIQYFKYGTLTPDFINTLFNAEYFLDFLTRRGEVDSKFKYIGFTNNSKSRAYIPTTVAAPPNWQLRYQDVESLYTKLGAEHSNQHFKHNTIPHIEELEAAFKKTKNFCLTKFLGISRFKSMVKNPTNNGGGTLFWSDDFFATSPTLEFPNKHPPNIIYQWRHDPIDSIQKEVFYEGAYNTPFANSQIGLDIELRKGIRGPTTRI